MHTQTNKSAFIKAMGGLHQEQLPFAQPIGQIDTTTGESMPHNSGKKIKTQEGRMAMMYSGVSKFLVVDFAVKFRLPDISFTHRLWRAQSCLPKCQLEPCLTFRSHQRCCPTSRSRQC